MGLGEQKAGPGAHAPLTSHLHPVPANAEQQNKDQASSSPCLLWEDTFSAGKKDDPYLPHGPRLMGNSSYNLLPQAQHRTVVSSAQPRLRNEKNLKNRCPKPFLQVSRSPSQPANTHLCSRQVIDTTVLWVKHTILRSHFWLPVHWREVRSIQPSAAGRGLATASSFHSSSLVLTTYQLKKSTTTFY